MRLVVPGMLMGTPAIMTMLSPVEITPNSFSILFDLSNISSVSFHSGTTKRKTSSKLVYSSYYWATIQIQVYLKNKRDKFKIDFFGKNFP